MIETILIYDEAYGNDNFEETSLDPIQIFVCANHGNEPYECVSLEWRHAHERIIEHHREHQTGGKHAKHGAPKIQRLIIVHPDPDIHNKQISEELKKTAKKHDIKHINLLERHGFRHIHRRNKKE